MTLRNLLTDKERAEMFWRTYVWIYDKEAKLHAMKFDAWIFDHLSWQEVEALTEQVQSRKKRWEKR